MVDFSFNGKKTINGVEYTFKDGLCTSNYRGWKKIDGKYYYFDRTTGAQLRSCTVDGIRLNSDGSAVSSSYNNEKIRTMIKARSIMESITNTSDSKETKLRKCFNWVMKHPYKRYRTLKVARQKADGKWCSPMTTLREEMDAAYLTRVHSHFSHMNAVIALFISAMIQDMPGLRLMDVYMTRFLLSLRVLTIIIMHPTGFISFIR